MIFKRGKPLLISLLPPLYDRSPPIHTRYLGTQVIRIHPPHHSNHHQSYMDVPAFVPWDPGQIETYFQTGNHYRHLYRQHTQSISRKRKGVKQKFQITHTKIFLLTIFTIHSTKQSGNTSSTRTLLNSLPQLNQLRHINSGSSSHHPSPFQKQN